MNETAVRAARQRMLHALHNAQTYLASHNITLSTSSTSASALFRSVLEEGRVTRIAVVGRRRSGRSTLCQTLFRADIDRTQRSPSTRHNRTHTHEHPTIHIWDLPGFRSVSREQTTALFQHAAPDLVLFCIPATEVDAGVDDDISDLKQLLSSLPSEKKPRPLFAVLTRSDEMDPAECIDLPIVDGTKLTNLAQAIQVLTTHGSKARLRFTHATTVAMDPDRVETNHNIATLESAILEQIPSRDTRAQRLLETEFATLLVSVVNELTDAFTRAARANIDGVDPLAVRREFVRTVRMLTPDPDKIQNLITLTDANDERASSITRTLTRWIAPEISQFQSDSSPQRWAWRALIRRTCEGTTARNVVSSLADPF